MLKNIPAKTILVILAIGTFIGFAIVGSFNAFMDYTSSNEFCSTTCHEMSTVTEEYMTTPLYKNNHGFRVKCADCHVPKPLFAKLWRKVKASREIYHKVMGTIDTPEKFEAKRIVLARNEWRRLKESDSRECRSCHVYEAMTISTQPNDARFWHPVAMDWGLDKDYSCIDCHKGFVHQLPDLKGEIKKAEEQFKTVLAADALTGNTLIGGVLYATRVMELYSGVGADAEALVIAKLVPGTPLTVLAREDGRFQVRVQGRQYQNNRQTLYKMGDQMVALALMLEEPLVSNGKVTQDSATGLTWRPAELKGWVSREGLVSRIAPLWDYGKALYQNECVSCHVVFSPSDFWATQWENKIHDMQRKIDLTPEQTNVMLRYLQHHAKPQGEI